ncbi:MAG: molybdopterin molybdotransferase MoeA [Firmicutes bacterium]|nr:molybdopterin molybdotransferase MoeA [Bacillota bacterium]
MELLKVDSLEKALEKLTDKSMGIKPETKKIKIENALGRIIAEDVISGENVPGFRRSTMDGYAVLASDTVGAGESMPVFLKVVGNVEMGEDSAIEIKAGQCAYVPTGAMIPDGATAVVMEEYCEKFSEDQIAVYQSAADGTHVVEADEDVARGEKILQRGRRIKPQDMGLLASVGHTEIEVYKSWTCYIISTGDELIDPDEPPQKGKVRDVNTYGLIGMAASLGFEIKGFEKIKDQEELLEDAVERGKNAADIVIVSGGSSKGKKDATAKILDKLSSSGVFTHGIAVKPGKPTILAVDEPSNSILAGLPGHPVAALIVFRQIIGALWNHKTGAEEELSTMAQIDTNLASSPGRKTFQLVKLTHTEEGNIATPVLGKSGLIYTMTKADGYIVIDRNLEGLKAGEKVKVYYI